jgi:hypothetical protein
MVADPTAINRETRRAAEMYNGTIDALQIKDAIVNTAKVQDTCFNRYEIHTAPFGSGTITLDRTQIVNREWVYPSGGTISWTAEEDGVLSGALEFTVRCFLQNVSDEVYGWSIGVFQDGILIGRTDQVKGQFWGGSLPLHGIVTKGIHNISIGVRAYGYSASLAADPNNVISIYSTQLWFRLAKR